MVGDTGPPAGDPRWVRGYVPRVERQRAHRRFLLAVRPRTAMLSVLHARRLVRDGESAATYFPPSTTVITTSTVPDRDLARLSWQEEYDVVSEFGADLHLPTDYPVYESMAEDDRRRHVKDCALGTLVFDREFDDGEVIPLIKGTTPAERAICERVAFDIEAPLICKYGGQYFMSREGGQFPALREVVESIAAETLNYPMLVVGFAGTQDGVPNRNLTLSALPGTVRAAASGRWTTDIDVRDAPPADLRAAYEEIDEAVADCLDVAPTYDRERAAARAPDELLMDPSVDVAEIDAREGVSSHQEVS